MRNATALLFLLLLLAPFAAGAGITMKDSFNKGETLIAKTSGSFFEAVSKENVLFYNGHVRTSIIPNVEKIGNDYYVYAQLIDKAPGNYSIVIKEAKYYNGSKIAISDIEKNFTISDDSADFSVDKGAISTNKSFFIQVKNLLDSKVVVDIGKAEGVSEESALSGSGFFATLFGSPSSGSSDSGSSISSVTLNGGESKKINFELSKNEPNLQTISLSSGNTNYEIPVQVSSSNISNAKFDLRFEPATLNISIATNSKGHSTFYLVNKGDADIENISLFVSSEIGSYVLLSNDYVDSISDNFSKKLEIDITSGLAEKTVSGNIAAVVGNDEFQAVIPVTLNFISGYVSPDGSTETNTASNTCSQIGGTICASSEECTGNFEYASDGVCCLSECSVQKTSSFWKIIGWLIIILLIVLVAWFYLKRYRKVESVSDLMKVLGR